MGVFYAGAVSRWKSWLARALKEGVWSLESRSGGHETVALDNDHGPSHAGTQRVTRLMYV